MSSSDRPPDPRSQLAATVPAGRDRARQVRRLVWPLAATIGVAFGALLYGFSVLITAEGAGGVFSATVLSTAFGGSVVTSGIAAIPVGRWADRAGVRPVLATGATLVAVGFVGFGLATASWQVLAVWWFVIGPGAAMVLFDPGFIALEQWCTPLERNRAAGTLTLITGLAGPIFIPATTLGLATIGWRWSAAVLGLLVAAVGWLTAAVLLRSAPHPQPHRAAPEPAARSARRGPARRSRVRRPSVPRFPAAARSSTFVLLTIASAAAFAAVESVSVHRIARFEASGFDPATLAWWAAFASAASLPGRYLVPRLAARFDGAAVLAVVSWALVPAIGLAIIGTETWQMIGHFTLFGAVFGAAIPLRSVVMGDRFRGATFGALMGVQSAAIAGGRAFGPTTVGWLRDRTGSYTPGMLWVTVLMGASALAATVVAVRGGCTREGPTPR